MVEGTKVGAVRGGTPGEASGLLFAIICSECERRAYVYSDKGRGTYCSTYCEHISRQDPSFPVLIAMAYIGAIPTLGFSALEELLG